MERGRCCKARHSPPFCLNGDVGDRKLVWPDEWDDDVDDDDLGESTLSRLLTEGRTLMQELERRERSLPPMEAIGQFGFREGHPLALVYDGDEWLRFDLKLLAISPRAERGARYPRVVARQGRAPRR